MIIYGTHRHIKENIPGSSTPVSTYIFNIKETDNEIIFICTYDSIRDTLYESNKNDNDNYSIIVDIFDTLIKTYKNIFVKEYTGQQIASRCEHVIIETRFDADDVHKSWSCIPKEVRIRNGKFYVYWNIKETPLEFDIQLDSLSDDISNNMHTVHINSQNNNSKTAAVSQSLQLKHSENIDYSSNTSFGGRQQPKVKKELSTSAVVTTAVKQPTADDNLIVHKVNPDTNNVNIDEKDAVNEFSQNFKELSFDEIRPLNDTEVVKLRSLRSTPATQERKKRDRQRVEEARLRAKLAVYKAEKAIQKYISRYGNIDDLESSGGEETDASADTDF
jgi:hypothetical protein